MAGTVWTAAQITLFGGAVKLLPSWSTQDVAHAGRQCREDRIEGLDDFLFAANHHAVTSFQSPHTTARAHIHIVDPLRRKFLCTADIIYVVGITTINHDVSRLEVRQEVGDGFVHHRGRNHQPYRPRLLELLHKILQ
jgi:hypothetical protein